VVMPPLRDIVVAFAFYTGLHGPGRVPGFSPWSSPIPPPLSHSVDVRRNFLTPLHSPPPHRPLSPRWSRCDVHLGLVECAPSNGVCCVRWFVVDTKFPPSDCHFGSFQIFGQCFGSHVGVEEEVETQLGLLQWEDHYQFMTVRSNPPLRKKPPRGLVV